MINKSQRFNKQTQLSAAIKIAVQAAKPVEIFLDKSSLIKIRGANEATN